MTNRQPIFTDDLRLLETLSACFQDKWVQRLLKQRQLYEKIQGMMQNQKQDKPNKEELECKICGRKSFTKFQQLNAHMNCHRAKEDKKKMIKKRKQLIKKVEKVKICEDIGQ